MNERRLLLEALGHNVRSKRKALGLSQTKLANESRLHRTYLADVERGARNVSILNVAKIAKALHIPISDLCHGIDEAREPHALIGSSSGSELAAEHSPASWNFVSHP